jgi:hypothetical protein
MEEEEIECVAMIYSNNSRKIRSYHPDTRNIFWNASAYHPDTYEIFIQNKEKYCNLLMYHPDIY